MKYLFILFYLLSFTFNLESKTLVCRFNNYSKYCGKIKIHRAIPIEVTKFLRDEGYQVDYLNGRVIEGKKLNRKKVKLILKEEKGNVLISGIIYKFSISRIGVMSAGFGGYVKYKTDIKIEYKVYFNEHVTNFMIEKELTDSRFGATIFGGPSVSDFGVSVTDLMESVKFGSKEFYKTIIGKTLKENIKEFIIKFKTLFSSAKEMKIVKISRNDIYINTGGKILKRGEECLIIEKGKPIIDPVTGKLLGHEENEIGIIKITRVINSELARAKIIKIFKKSKKPEVNMIVKQLHSKTK